MYANNLYEYDRNQQSYIAKLLDGALIYRLASLQHCSISDALTGAGTLNNPSPGRFNAPHQRTTYCANNILVCIAEVLFHMYRKALKKIEVRDPALAIRSSMYEKRCLMLIRVKEIDPLVYADSKDVARDFDPRVCGASVVFPDPCYKFLWEFGNTVRTSGSKGIFYPSARHLNDICIALFYDESTRLDMSFHELLDIELRLISEDQDRTQPLRNCDPFDDKIHPTMGYYSFSDANELDRLRNLGVLNPNDIPASGLVDFVRRRYTAYPAQAVCH
jgi:RES domain